MDLILLFEEAFKAHGLSFGMLVVYGFIVAFMVEISIKKAYDTNIKKVEGEKKKAMESRKSFVCSVIALIASALSAVTVMKGMNLPGGEYLFPCWFCIVFLVQYCVSMKGIKYYQYKLATITEKPAKTSKPKTSKKSVKIGEGEKLYKKLDDGTIVEV